MKKVFTTLAIFLSVFAVQAQSNFGIGTATPAASAALDVTSTTQGILVPRMTTTARNNISSPAKGLMVYDSTLNSFYYHNGTAWTTVGTASATSIPNAFSSHTTTAASIAAFSYHSLVNSTSVASNITFVTPFYAPSNATVTINVASYVGSAYTLDLCTVQPVSTSATSNLGTVLTTINIAAWASGNPQTGTITYTLSAGTIYTIRTSGTTNTGLFFLSVNAQ